MLKHALIEGPYRYRLGRRWSPDGATLGFLMLNPSTADADINDPTIVRCIGFAKAAKYAAIEVVNLFAYRATEPKEMWAARRSTSVIGWDNDFHIEQVVQQVDRLILAWGAQITNNDYAKKRADEVLEKLREERVGCLGLTKYGEPRHPLMVRADQPIMGYNYRMDHGGLMIGPSTCELRN